MRLWEAALQRIPLLRLGGQDLVLWVVLGIFFFLHLFSVPDPDYYWHLRTGQYIVETGTLPSRDPFSYTAVDRPWVLHEWGSQVIMFWLDRQLSLTGLVWFFSFLTALALYLQFRLLVGLGIHKLVAAVAVFIMGMILWPFFSLRPLTFSWLFITVYLLLLYRRHRGGRAPLWPLPLLMLAWVNLHGGFIFGIVLMALLLGAQLLERRLLRQARPILPLAGALGLTALATAVSPASLQAFLYPLSYLGADNASLEFILEWQSPNFHDPYWLVVLLPLLLLAHAVGLASLRLGAWPLALWALVVAMALVSVRNVPVFALVGVAVLVEAFKERVAWARFTAPAPESARKILLNWAVLVAALIPVVVIIPRVPRFQSPSDPLTLAQTAPEQGAAWIAECRPQARMFNDYNWGGYLLYRLYPQQRVFIDGRADLYGARLLREYADVVRLRPSWRELLDRYGVDLVIFRKEQPLTVALDLDPGWKRVFLGPVEAIYLSASGAADIPAGCTEGDGEPIFG